ncbi:MAG: ribonuclease E/G [Micavibrio sp.]|nr:ribonuclease E/G [Micavibrio sp.]
MEVDPVTEEVRWGSIYWARVTAINKAIDAVFLDLDGDNTGILYNSDTRWKDKDGKYHKGGAEAIGKRFSSGDMVAVQAKTSYMPSETDDFIGEENKTCQMSMDITLPGRYMIYCAHVNENRVSQRIRDKDLRKQLHKMLDNMEGVNGCILRAAAANTQTEVLMREHRILKGAWKDISDFFEGNSPQLIALGPDAIQRTLSDQATRHIERIEVVTMDHFSEVEDWCSIFAPDLVTKIEPQELPNAEDDLALFEYRDIIGQIEALFHDYVMLKGGGSLIIQSTAALIAIDVNKGSNKGSNLSVNIEAAHEIARQLRLRNCGGAIVIDFLKLPNKKDQAKVISALGQAINLDPCTIQIHGFTALGHVEITRKRRTPELEDRFHGDLI